ncbi:hypothetical protein MMC06_005750 [Schaereria dolodes]|nr:hypothetical protein [Schaereria dolodes]
MESITGQLQTLPYKIQHNITNAVTNLTLKHYIRLVVIVGGYALLRPYLLKLGARFQAKDHDRELDPNEMSSAAAISPNSLRGQIPLPEDSESEEEKGASTATSWGRKARRRQRHMIRKIVEAEEQLKAEEAEADSDKEIEEFLMQ